MAPSATPKRILIVDDDADVRTILRDFLSSICQFDVSEASNGKEALEVLHPSHDLVVTDLSMPVMGGVELIRRIRAHPDVADIPILAVSGLPGSNKQTLLEVGASAFLPKPVRLAELQDTIRGLS